MSETLDKIRLHVKAGRVRVSQHGKQELSDDDISLAVVVAGLEEALVVECSCAARSRFPRSSYYQLWHDVTHVSAPAKRWLREQVREVARNLAGHGMLTRRARMTVAPAGGRAAPQPGRAPRATKGPFRSPGGSAAAPAASVGATRLALRGDLLDFTADPGWGDAGSRRRCAGVPTTGCWSKTAASSACCRPKRPTPVGPAMTTVAADPARLHRHACAHPAARCDRAATAPSCSTG